MKENKTPIKQVFERLSISKATLYNRLRRLDILPLKDGKNSYLTDKQIEKIKAYDSSKNTKKLDKPLDTSEEKLEIKTLRRRLKAQKKALKREREENKNLILKLGHWEGRARTLEEQNNKLLLLAPAQKEEPKKGFFQRFLDSIR